MPQPSVWHDQFVHFSCAECFFVEFQRFDPILNGQVRRYRVVPLRDWFCFHIHSCSRGSNSFVFWYKSSNSSVKKSGLSSLPFARFPRILSAYESSYCSFVIGDAGPRRGALLSPYGGHQTGKTGFAG